jgi:branched-subunit amino acid transport protein AzlD
MLRFTFKCIVQSLNVVVMNMLVSYTFLGQRSCRKELGCRSILFIYLCISHIIYSHEMSFLDV